MSEPDRTDGTDRRGFLIEGGTLAAMICAGQTSANTTAAEPNVADDAARLNATFRELYGTNRAELLAECPLAVLMLIGTGEVWRVEHGKAVRSYAPIGWISKVKGLMHGVIATQATGARLARAGDAGPKIEAAKRLSAALAQAVEQAAMDLPPEVAAPAAKVLSALAALAKGWAETGKAAPDAVRTAMQPVMGELDKVLTAAGEAVFESVVKGLRSCAAESDPKLWSEAIVGVCGVGFARRDSIEIAACMDVIGREAIGTRILYMENAFTIEAGVNVLASALADRDLGRDVFGDPYRMWRDLLGDVAVRRAGGGFFPETGRE